jgi:hypothetical protein
LSKPLPGQSSTLLKEFWPSSNWVSNYFKVSLSTAFVTVDPEDPIQLLYCGSKNMKPSITYTPVRDFNDEDFVLVRLHDPNCVSIWMGKTQGDVVKDEENAFFKMVKVQWWVHVKKGTNMNERNLYEDC